MKIYKAYKLSNYFKLVFFLFTLCILFLFSEENFSSAKNTINIFFFSVMPSLFPFIFFTNVILKTDIIDILSNLFGKIFSKIFKVNRNCTSSIIIGFLCGFPMGAKSVISSFENGKITSKDTKILLSFINNCNPIFIISTIAINIFGSVKIGLILLISHIISAITLGIISSRYLNNNIIQENNDFLKSLCKKNTIKNKKIEKDSFFEIVTNSILNTFVTLEIILGFMLIFNILSNIIFDILSNFNIPNTTIHILTAFFEVTNGCYSIGGLNINIYSKILIISFMIGFSGLCIIFQIYSVIYKYKFKITKLIKFKLLHGIISIFITYILIKIIGIDEQNILSSFSNIDTFENKISYNNLLIPYLTQTIGIICILVMYYVYKRKKYK